MLNKVTKAPLTELINLRAFNFTDIMNRIAMKTEYLYCSCTASIINPPFIKQSDWIQG